MTQSTPKTILAIGLGSDSVFSNLDRDAVRKDIQAGVEEAHELGYEVVTLFADPNTPDAIEVLREKLRSQHFDGVSIGFGVRGNADMTDFFEKMVNAVIEEVKPAPKMMFSTRPRGIVEAIQRVF